MAAAQPIAPVRTLSGVPFVLVLLGILALIAVIGIGGVVYVGYLVKQKVTSVARAVSDHGASAKAARDAATGGWSLPASK
jgi:hypothetical protein